MAATSLTISREVKKWTVENLKSASYIHAMLGAPGWDCLLYDCEPGGYTALYGACADVADKLNNGETPTEDDVAAIRRAAEECEKRSLFLQAYGLTTYERFEAHKVSHVRYGTPWWRQRYDRYYAGTLKAALKAADPEAVAKAAALGNAA